jgi:hypothetical protein
MLRRQQRLGPTSSSFACDAPFRRGERRWTMSAAAATKAEFFADFRFNERELTDLLRALHARAASHPDNPGIIACWPAVPQHRMDAACRELIRHGHPVQPVAVTGWQPDKTRAGWALGA